MLRRHDTLERLSGGAVARVRDAAEAGVVVRDHQRGECRDLFELPRPASVEGVGVQRRHVRRPGDG